jgi:cytochrome c2
MLEVDLERKTARVLTIGNRNVQGVMVDKHGQIWAVEHGPRGGDELNRIVEGKNFGWPEVTLGTRYNHLPWPTSGQYGRHELFDPPVFAWVPSVAISNIMQIENFDPSWDGDFLVASLLGQTLFRLRMQDDRVVFAEPIPIGQGIRYAHMHTDGRIVLWTDTHSLIFISRGDATLTAKFIETKIGQLYVGERRKQNLRGAIDRCSECHSFDPLDNTGAPSLGTVFGRPIAATTFTGYSEALRAHSGKWTAPELTKFLSGPQAYAPGTSMPDPGLSDETTADMLTVLEALAAPEKG